MIALTRITSRYTTREARQSEAAAQALCSQTHLDIVGSVGELVQCGAEDLDAHVVTRCTVVPPMQAMGRVVCVRAAQSVRPRGTTLGTINDVLPMVGVVDMALLSSPHGTANGCQVAAVHQLNVLV